MGRFENLDDTSNDIPAAAATRSGPDFIAATLANTDIGGLKGVVAELQAAGLEGQVRSWLGSGGNLPITTEELRAALGDEQLRQVADEFGLPIDATVKVLADQLPNAVDRASPDGRLPD